MNLPRPPIPAVVLALVLAACATPPLPTLQAASRDDNAALLDAAEAALAGDRPDDARTHLRGIAPGLLDPRQQLRRRLVQAEVLLAEGQPGQALAVLPRATELTDPALAVRAAGDRASALFALGDAVAATQVLLGRERLLPDDAARQANRDQLWSALRSATLDGARSPQFAAADAATRGWIELAVISRSVWLDRAALDARLERWRTDFPGHPASERIPTLTQVATGRGEPVAAIGLLLPLSGPHARAAEALRDGFFAAYYGSGGASPAPRPSVRLYDTGATPDTLLAAYHRALDDGAGFLVGPLTREDVAALAALGRQPVPVLALNYLEANQPVPFNFFQWGLAPEDEARQAAERAVVDGRRRAVALVPEGEWGQRVLQAFSERLAGLGGTVVGERSYVPTERDHSAEMRDLLSLDQSNERHRALTVVLGRKTEFQPRRRDDVDFVFLAARAEQARLLGPQLRFHRTGELPIWATSSIYDGGEPPADLNGLRFCDMPWMIAPEGPLAELRARVEAVFPRRPADFSRLLALGHDAYTLVRLIDGGLLESGAYFPAASGTLAMRGDGVVTRGLSCAEIRNGKVQPLGVALTAR